MGMDQLEDLNAVLTVMDLTKFLKISRGKAYELVHSGELHIVRVGTRILVPKTSLQAWLQGENR
jgi:excisionase family DNA binding protein